MSEVIVKALKSITYSRGGELVINLYT